MSIRKFSVLKKKAKTSLPYCSLRNALQNEGKVNAAIDGLPPRSCKRLACWACGPRRAYRWFRQHELKVNTIRDKNYGFMLPWKTIERGSRGIPDYIKFIDAAKTMHQFLKSEISPALPGFALVTELGPVERRKKNKQGKTGAVAPHLHIALFTSPRRMEREANSIEKYWEKIGGRPERMKLRERYLFRNTIGYMTKDAVSDAFSIKVRKQIGLYLLNPIESMKGTVRVQTFGGVGLSPQGFVKLRARARYQFLRKQGLRPWHLGIDPDERYASYCPEIRSLRFAQQCEKCKLIDPHEFIRPSGGHSERWKCRNSQCGHVWDDQPVTYNICSPKRRAQWRTFANQRAARRRGYNTPRKS